MLMISSGRNEIRGRVVSWVFTMALALTAPTSFAQKLMPVGSSSMEPTLHKGDRVTVNLLAYVVAKPARGDVVAYEVPGTNTFYIHRIIALPGEVVAYDARKRLSIDGVDIPLRSVQDAPSTLVAERSGLTMFDEALPGAHHRLLIDAQLPALSSQAFENFPNRELCTLSAGGFRCTVPSGHYFVMGDNRDWAQDSRYLGFIPAELIGGKIDSP